MKIVLKRRHKVALLEHILDSIENVYLEYHTKDGHEYSKNLYVKFRGICSITSDFPRTVYNPNKNFNDYFEFYCLCDDWLKSLNPDKNNFYWFERNIINGYPQRIIFLKNEIDKLKKT